MSKVQHRNWLRCYHVLLRRYELYTALAELRPLVVVQALALTICPTQVLWWTLTDHSTQVALIPPTGIELAGCVIHLSKR